MKNYISYIKEKLDRSDIDPYGEEDWTELNDYKGVSFFYIRYYPRRPNNEEFINAPEFLKLYCHGIYYPFKGYYYFSLDNKRNVTEKIFYPKDFDNLIENEEDYTEDKSIYLIKADNPYLWMRIMDKVFKRYKEDVAYINNEKIEKMKKRVEKIKNLELEEFIEFSQKNYNTGF